MLVLFGQLLAACGSQPASSDAEGAKIAPGDRNRASRVPESVLKKLSVSYPTLSVATEKELSGECSGDDNSGACPYCAWGDFNGDTRTDIAVILLGKDRWRLVIFHRSKDDYMEAYSTGGGLGGGPA